MVLNVYYGCEAVLKDLKHLPLSQQRDNTGLSMEEQILPAELCAKTQA